MTENIHRRLVAGLVGIGDDLDLQIFTASNGAALLDWSSTEHRVLTVWAHDGGAEVRIGTAVHALTPLGTESEVDRLLDLLREVVVDGTWYETYTVHPRSGEIEALGWRLGVGNAGSLASPGRARLPSEGLRVHRQGHAWGPRTRPAAPPG